MSDQNLHRNVVLSLLLPDKAGSNIIASNKFLCTPGDGYASEWNLIRIHIEFSGFISGQVPNPYAPLLVTKENFTLIWMQNCTVDHDTCIVKVAHIPTCFKVENLKGSVLTGRKKPLIILLKF
jgi:hypothetical protein